MQRLKVLFITSWYPRPRRESYGIFVREHAKAVQLYDDVTVLHLAGIDASLPGLYRLTAETDPALTDGLETYRLRSRKLPIPKTSALLAAWAFRRTFDRFLSRHFRPDVVHANVYRCGYLAAKACRRHDIPLVITEHWSGFPKKMLKGLDPRRARKAFQWAECVMPVSDSLRDAIRDYGIRANFRVVPNAVNTELFTPKAAPVPARQVKRMLLVCNMISSHIKNIPLLLRTLGKLRRRRDWRMDLVGEGPDRPRWQAIVDELDLGEQVFLPGYQPKAQIAETMRRADFLVLPSLSENMPCVIIEAMAAGLPVVATRTGAVPQLLGDSRGLLIPVDDGPALLAALDHMLDHYGDYDPQAISRFATERFSYEAVGKTIHEIYLQAIARHAT